MVELADEQFERARRRGETRLQGPRAVAVRYDAGRGRIVIVLSTKVELGLAPRDVEGLAGASADDLKAVEIESQGLGIHFPRLDADLYVPALLDGAALDGTIGQSPDDIPRHRPDGWASTQVRTGRLVTARRR